MLVICLCALFSVSDEMARLSLLVPLAMIILRQFGIVYFTSPYSIAELRGIQIPIKRKTCSHLECQSVCDVVLLGSKVCMNSIG